MSNELPSELRNVDSLLERYYRSMRETKPLHPLERMRLLHDGAVLGGASTEFPEDLAIVDLAYTKATSQTRLVMDVWYKYDDPSHIKADRVGMSRTAFYNYWRAGLWYFHGFFRAKGLTV